jgi:hypothetical protein
VQILFAALFGIFAVIVSTPLLLVTIVLVQMLYVQDLLGEQVSLLGDHEGSA